MFRTPSLLRRAEHTALSSVILNGSVLDLGGERDAEYLACIKGAFTVTAVNIDPAAKPDIIHDLEKPLPIPDATYDHVLLINVLEHIFDYRALLKEAIRVVRPGGSVVIVVPFLFPIHPSPHDFWRFTGEALRRVCEELGLAESRIVPLGTGVFAVRHLMLDRLLPGPVRGISNYTARFVTNFADKVFSYLAQRLGKRYTAAEYALGYLVHAHKNSHHDPRS